MSETIPTAKIIYIGIGRNKYYQRVPSASPLPLEVFQHGLFLRFSQEATNLPSAIYHFFDHSYQKTLSIKERETYLQSQIFGADNYIDCYFKNNRVIISFLENFNQTYIFKESHSDKNIDIEQLILEVESLS